MHAITTPYELEFSKGFTKDLSKQTWIRPLALALMPQMHLLLIDSDRSFRHAFEAWAKVYRIAARSLDSVDKLAAHTHWDYDMVVIDAETVGEENIREAVCDIVTRIGNVPIIVVDNGQTQEESISEWSRFTSGYYNKSRGIETIVTEALKISGHVLYNRSKASAS